MQDKLKKLREWFNDFTASFLGESDFVDENVALKQCHTMKVCQEMNFLTSKVGIKGDGAILAEIIALLHDVGRFEQIKRYKTFEDAKSIDHSKLGIEIIDELGLLSDFSALEQKIIKVAIAQHNKKELQLSPDLPEECLLFARLIRDADKIDIYRVVINGYKLYMKDPDKFNLAISFKSQDDGKCSPKVVNALLNKESINYTDLKNINDRKLLQLIWLYDINFTDSLKRIIERGYVDFIVSQLPETKDCVLIKKTINIYINQRLANNA